MPPCCTSVEVLGTARLLETVDFQGNLLSPKVEKCEFQIAKFHGYVDSTLGHTGALPV